MATSSITANFYTDDPKTAIKIEPDQMFAVLNDDPSTGGSGS